tara:strand:+ start:9490 stop:11403 length:1914 start_codon:yes stop_codon:yes gene_type:complete
VIVPNSRITLTCLVSAIAIIMGAAKKGFTQEIDTKSFSAIPDRFFQVQDSFGFFWSAAPNGALTSGETQYLQSGLNLLIDDQKFRPNRGSEVVPAGDSDSAQLLLCENRDGLEISRDFLFDKERGGVRIVDTFSNTSGAAVTLRVQLRTTYPFGWKSLHGSDGSQLNGEPALALAEGEGGILVRFGASEGRPDTLILASDGQPDNQPNIEASANRRELVVGYSIDLKPNSKRMLLHWVLQRSLAEAGEAEGELSNFWQRGKLIRSGVEANLANHFQNFDSKTFPRETVAPPRLRSLISLNELIDRVGIHRRNEELLWISTANQLAGQADPGEVLNFEASHLGLIEVKVSDIAAIKGGAGFGRRQLIFLRDGSVLSGEAIDDELTFDIAGAKDQSLNLAALNLLLFRAGESDGVPPVSADVFVELRDGSVMALSDSDSVVLAGNTAWGEVEIPISVIATARYSADPHPRLVLLTLQGSRLSVFVRDIPLFAKLSSGEEVEISALSVKRIWRANADGFASGGDSSDWIALSEVPGDIPQSAALLMGNNLIAGALTGPELLFDVEGTTMTLPAAQIVAMTRLFGGVEESPEKARFEASLEGGDSISGRLLDPFVRIDAQHVTIVPTQHIVDYRNAVSSEE